MTQNWFDSVVPADATPPPRDIDVSVAHPARVYDYWLGGKDNFAAANNTHEVAQSVRPEARVVYVDNDPIVLAHARALLTSVAGPTMFIDADLRGVGPIVSRAGQTLDFSRPVAVMLIAVLHLIPDEDDPWGIVASFMDAVPSGSYLVVTHPARD